MELQKYHSTVRLIYVSTLVAQIFLFFLLSRNLQNVSQETYTQAEESKAHALPNKKNLLNKTHKLSLLDKDNLTS